MDRADAPPPEGVGGALSARHGASRSRAPLPPRAAPARGPGGSGAYPRARGSPGRGAPRGARPAYPPGGRARGLVPAPRSRRDSAAPRGGSGAGGARLRAASDPRPAHSLGELLHERHDELQLEAAAGAAGDPRLRRGARGGAPRRTGPLAAFLAARGVALPGLARARALVAPPRPCAPVSLGTTPSGRTARRGIARRPPRRPPRARRRPRRRLRPRSPRTARRSGA